MILSRPQTSAITSRSPDRPHLQVPMSLASAELPTFAPKRRQTSLEADSRSSLRHLITNSVLCWTSCCWSPIFIMASTSAFATEFAAVT